MDSIRERGDVDHYDYTNAACQRNGWVSRWIHFENIMIEKLFIHIPKNGGMTIRRNRVLRPKVILSTPDVHKDREYTRGLERKMNETEIMLDTKHARWRDLTPKLTNNVQAFAFVRNPWDRVVSRYWFAKKVIEIEKESDHYGETDYADTSTFEPVPRRTS